MAGGNFSGSYVAHTNFPFTLTPNTKMDLACKPTDGRVAHLFILLFASQWILMFV